MQLVDFLHFNFRLGSERSKLYHYRQYGGLCQHNRNLFRKFLIENEYWYEMNDRNQIADFTKGRGVPINYE